MRIKGMCALVVALSITALLGCQARPPQVSGLPPPAILAIPEPDYWPTGSWKSSTPEQQGMDSARLAAMFDAVERQRLNLHSILIIRNGYLVTEAYFSPYDATVRQQLASVTKSVTGMLAGIAISRGRIRSIDEPVLPYFANRTIANLNQNKRNLTLEHLLTLTTGLDCSDDAGTRDRMFQSPDWVQFTLDLPMAAAPGKQFSYCSPAVHLVSAIVTQAMGQSARELANEALFAPVGVAPAGPQDWATDPQGVTQGFGGLALTPRDMARLGFLYLHGGRWQGQQVVPASWVTASLAPHAAGSQGRGYGYLFWLYKDQGYKSAMGMGGQDIHIIPAKNLVVVFTAAMDGPTHDVEVIKLLDDYIVPAAAATSPLSENQVALAQLQARIARAASPQVAAPRLPALAATVSGKVYQVDANPNGWETISLTFRDGSPEAVAAINGSNKLQIGLDNVYRTMWTGSTGEARRGHWEGEDTFVVDDHMLGAFFHWQFRVTFPGDQLRIEVKELVNGNTALVTGHVAP